VKGKERKGNNRGELNANAQSTMQGLNANAQSTMRGLNANAQSTMGY
jgi:hypothetical protein